MISFRGSLLVFITLGSLIQASPAHIQYYRYSNSGWNLSDFPADASIIQSEVLKYDLDLDGIQEGWLLSEGQLTINTNSQILWASPADWQVKQVCLSDFDRDSFPELLLLVSRPHQPWPVDRWLPYGGRISNFQDSNGASSHIILIGWQSGKFDEIWAGSSMSSPALKVAVQDFNQDGKMELLTLEGDYQRSGYYPAHALKMWEWNGFGFTLSGSQEGIFLDFEILISEKNPTLVYVLAY